MKTVNCLLCILFCVFLSSITKAQGTYTGCYLPSTNKVYTREPYPPYFLPVSGAVSLSPSYCYWTPTSGPATCTVCTVSITQTCDASGNNCVFTSCNGAQVGIRGTFTMIYCSLDENILLLLLTSGAVALSIIYKEKLSSN